jgi:hypothetical protein
MPGIKGFGGGGNCIRVSEHRQAPSTCVPRFIRPPRRPSVNVGTGEPAPWWVFGPTTDLLWLRRGAVRRFARCRRPASLSEHQRADGPPVLGGQGNRGGRKVHLDHLVSIIVADYGPTADLRGGVGLPGMLGVRKHPDRIWNTPICKRTPAIHRLAGKANPPVPGALPLYERHPRRSTRRCSTVKPLFCLQRLENAPR